MSARIITAIALLVVPLAACGESEPSADGMINDASKMAAGVEQAAVELPEELRAAAVQRGDLPCGLPLLPDHRAGRVTDNNKTSTFNTDATPEQVAAFYKLAAETWNGSATISGPPGMSEIKVATPEARSCTIVAQAQMSGDTNVTVRF